MINENFKVEDRIIKISLIFALIALSIGGIFGITQLISRTPYLISIDPSTYYTLLTGHGVLMAIVWISFVIIAIAIFVVTRALNISLNKSLLNSSILLSLVGSVISLITILSGNSNVLYTFYPPLEAYSTFYIGLLILVIGTWLFTACIFIAYFRWRKNNPRSSIPIPVYGVLTTLIVWLEATPGLFIEIVKDLLPMSLLGLSISPLEARTYFWYFGHPLVYFWLIPAITLWYFIIPKVLNTNLYSENMAKVVFILFIITSTPVGLHHQFFDPGIDNYFKFLQTILTYIVAIASFLTAFNILATLENKFREEGNNSILGWLKYLPWKNPTFSSIMLAFIVFGVGGITGIINASYMLNYEVHNSTWIVGHFHNTVGTAVTLTFMSSLYFLAPILFRKNLFNFKLAQIQPYIWFVGMMIFSISYYIAGLSGMPRRTSSILNYPFIPNDWILISIIASFGGIFLFTSGVFFIYNTSMTLWRGKVGLINGAIMNFEKNKMTVLDNLRIGVYIAIVIIIVAYRLPIYKLYSMGLNTQPPVIP